MSGQITCAELFKNLLLLPFIYLHISQLFIYLLLKPESIALLSNKRKEIMYFIQEKILKILHLTH